jgi:hypothetical protein
MFIKFCFSTSILSFLFILGCSSASPVDNEHFPNISIKEDVLTLDGKIDSSLVSFMFDSGCLVGCLIPDSTSNRILPFREINYFNGIGNTQVDSIFVCGFPYNSVDVNIINSKFKPQIAPNYAFDTRIWHFNLDSLSLRIDDDSGAIDDAIIIPIKFTERKGKKNAPIVNIPIVFSQNGVSIETDYYYLLDTGTPYGFAMTDPTKEILSFVDAIDARNYIDEYSLKKSTRKIVQFEIDFKFFDMTIPNLTCEIDTGLISFDSEFGNKFPHGDKPVVGTIGMRFLKFFNFDMDLQNKRLILRRNSCKFPSKAYNMNQFWCTDSGVVRRIGIESIAYKNGLHIGDKIEMLNRKRIADMPLEERDSLISMSQRLELCLSDGRLIQIER